ncbi:MAG: alpha/beta fold hydrolase [Pseudomonadota bacterium]
MKWLVITFGLVWAAAAEAYVAERATFDHDGRERAYYFYAPVGADDTTPLLIALHGMGGNARNLRFGIGLTEAAADAGFAVVYPQGVRLPDGSRHWNAGFDFLDVNDVGYLNDLARALIAEHGLSSKKVMILGISMGGFMAYHMACKSSLPIAGIVVVAGSIHPSDFDHCASGQRPSLLHIHGRLDPLVPFYGHSHWSLPGKPPVSVPDIVADWAAAAHARRVQATLSGDAIEQTRFVNPQDGIEVQLLELTAFGHDWPSEATAGYRALDDIIAFLVRQRDAWAAR